MSKWKNKIHNKIRIKIALFKILNNAKMKKTNNKNLIQHKYKKKKIKQWKNANN